LAKLESQRKKRPRRKKEKPSYYPQKGRDCARKEKSSENLSGEKSIKIFLEEGETGGWLQRGVTLEGNHEGIKE